jgi:hypothetical protein
MKYRKLITPLLLAVLVAGCRVLPEPAALYNEEIVLQVWDALDAYYGSDAFFECEYLRVHGGKIELTKPYPISDIAVVQHSSSTPPAAGVKLFRPVLSHPGQNEVVIEGTTLHFNPSYENEKLFVAWKPQSPTPHPPTNGKWETIGK